MKLANGENPTFCNPTKIVLYADSNTVKQPSPNPLRFMELSTTAQKNIPSASGHFCLQILGGDSLVSQVRSSHFLIGLP